MMTRFISWIRSAAERLFSLLFHLFAKWVMVVFLTTLIGMGWSWLLFWSQMFSGSVIKWLVVLALGTSSGIFARLIFYNHAFLIGWSGAFLAHAINLLALNYFTLGQTGFALNRGRSNLVNWDALGQLLVGGILAWIAMTAWKTFSRRKETAPQAPSPIPPVQAAAAALPSEPAAVSSRPVPALKKKSSRRLKTQASPKTPQAPASSSRSWSLGQLTTRMQKRIHTTANALTLQLKPRAVPAELKIPRSSHKKQKTFRPASLTLPKRVHKPRRMPIHLVGEEDHRCPYCLDAVDPQDPGGVVICSICHSYHHKACWDVTGTCQVPHIYA